MSEAASTTALALVLARTNVEAMHHDALARDHAAGKGEGARVFGLARMLDLLGTLGNPQHSAASSPIVHVAGSKGKGSVCEMVASGLSSAGVRTGLFTSPHVLHLRERFRIDGVPASDAKLEELAAHVLAADAQRTAPSLAQLGPATTFELLFAMFLVHCERAQVRARVIEVGLGGELDATNVVLREPGARGVCVLTSIQLEHTQLLGDTLPAIATHKAGILKPGIPALSVPQARAVRKVFVRCARERGVRLRILGDHDARFRLWPTRIPLEGVKPRRARIGCRVTLRFAGNRPPTCMAPWSGEHTAINACAALASCMLLAPHLPGLDLLACSRGIEAAKPIARLQYVSLPQTQGLPAQTLVVDGAHTPESVLATLDAVRSELALVPLSEFPPAPPRVVAIFGCASDKRAGEMLALLARTCEAVVLLEAGPRGMPASTPQAMAPHAQTASNATDALALARALATTHACSHIVALGSFHVAGDILRAHACPQACP
jgi:dihydrofolate synthase / folylpolyglutamate synthase